MDSNLIAGQDNSSATQKGSTSDNITSIDLQNKLLLDTSLGNNYIEVGNNSSYNALYQSSSKTSSIAGSTLKTNQTFDSTLDRGRSPSVRSDATTVIFADDATNYRIGTTSNSLQCLSNDLYSKQIIKQNNNSNTNYSEAPLASPETLSEISSVSSQNSIYDFRDDNDELELNRFSIFESQLHTPKVLRRALKFSENLSKCANDKRNLDQYKRLGRVFITNPLKMMQLSDNQSVSSKDSYQTDSIQLRAFENSKSADNIDNDIDTKTLDTKLTFSESTCINEVQDCLNHQIGQFSSIIDSKQKLSSNETFYSAKSSIEKMSTIKSKSIEHTVQNQETGILESHFPVYTADKLYENDTNIYLNRTSYGNLDNKTSANTIQRSKKKYTNEEKMFLLNESLPLLSNLSEKNKNKPTQKFSKRKGCVYPEDLIGNSPNVILSKNESNV